MASNPAASNIDLDSTMDKYYPYLMEIRKRLLFIAAIFFVASGFGFIYYQRIIRFILSMFNFEGVNIVFTSPFQFLELAVNSGLIIGFIAVIPLLIIQTISFLKPALSDKEFKTAVSILPLTALLFIGGFSYGIYIMRYVLIIFYERSVEFDIGNFLDISLLLSQTLLTSLLMGLSFQFPAVLTALMRFKVIRYKTLASQRLIAYSFSVIFAALLPPTDLLSLALLTVPLIFLYESTLIFNKYVLKSHKIRYTKK